MYKAKISEKIFSRFCPELYERVDWKNIWRLPFEFGKSFEWAFFAALASTASNFGLEIKFPLLEYKWGQSHFCLWNELPVHFVGKAGHQHLRENKVELAKKFHQSLIPKMQISTEKKTYSVFKEGCPYHSIMLEKNYPQRPDFLVIEGKPVDDYPRILSNGQFVEFAFELANSSLIRGILQVINTPNIPIEVKEPDYSMNIPVYGVVECSTSKTKSVAQNQLQTYEDLFSGNDNETILFLVTGNKISLDKWDCFYIDYSTSNLDSVFLEFKEVGEKSLKKLQII